MKKQSMDRLNNERKELIPQIGEQLFKREYFKFKDAQFIKEDMLLNNHISQEIKKRENREVGRCFYNSSQTLDLDFDYVLGFFIDGGSFLFEHAWNRRRDDKFIIDVTFANNLMENICYNEKLPRSDGKLFPKAIYVEVLRFTLEGFGKHIGKTKGDPEFFLHIEEHKKAFFNARMAILDLYKPIKIHWYY